MAGLHSYKPTGLAEWAARAFDLPKPPAESTIYTILDQREKFATLPMTSYGHKKVGDRATINFELALAAEFDTMEREVKTVTDDTLLVLAEHYATSVYKLDPDKVPGFSKGWLHRFKTRNGITSKRKYGEAASVDPAVVREGRIAIRGITDLYTPDNIYNMDETAFFYYEEAPSTLSRRNKIAGFKSDKTRLTLCVATNADGSDKFPLLFIGKAVKPRAFKGHDVATELGVEYTNSKKAWMNSVIFWRWLHALDLRMQHERRHILLLVDNASSHARPLSPLTNVRLEFLPKNTTSVLQPLDQGILLCIKRGFRRIKVHDCVRRYINHQPQVKITVFTALKWAKMAWDKVKPETIRNCWSHAGILSAVNAPTSMRCILGN